MSFPMMGSPRRPLPADADGREPKAHVAGAVPSQLPQPSPLAALLTSREAATILNVSARTLWTLTNEGDLPSVRVGHSVRYDPADLRAWIERRKTGNQQSTN
jgi:excisionase family DNA binding protein